MLAVLVIAVLAVAAVGLAVFVAMCVAIRNDDKKGLPGHAPSLIAALTRRFLGMSSGRPVSSSTTERELCGAGLAHADQRADAGER